MKLADVSEALGRKEDRVVYLRRAVEVCEEADRQRSGAEMVSCAFKARRQLAWALTERGDRELAGPLFAANHRLAVRGVSEGGDLDRPVRGLVSHIDWKLFIDGSTSAPAGGPVANPSGVHCPLAGLASPADGSQSPREWADMAARVLHATHADAGG